MGTLEQSEPIEPTTLTDVEVMEASIEPGGMGAIEDVSSDDTVDESDSDTDIGVVEIDITSELSADQIRDLFGAFDQEDWAEVDRLLDEWERNGVYTDTKAGGVDRNRGNAETLRRYWTVGVGGQKIRWGMPGDWTRCVQQLTEHLGPRAKGYCALRHKEMNGYYPGDKRNKSDTARNLLTSANKPSASVVFGSGDGFKVVGANTTTDSTEMVDMQPVRDSSVSDGVRQYVGGDDFSGKALDLPVASTQATSEQPTTISSKSKSVEPSFGTSTNSADTIVTSSSSPTKAGSMSTTQPNVMHGSATVSNTTNSHTKTVADSGGDIEFKTVGVKGMNVVSADEGIVETIISVTGIVDNVKDRINPGAYAKTLAKRKPKGVWSHDWDTPVSKTLDVKELLPGDPELPKTMPNGDPWPAGAGALKVKTQFNLDTQRGREAYSDVTFFAEEQEWSIGYNVPVGGAKVDQKSGVREIETLELYEYSPVLFGAMPLARTTSVKEAQLALKALKGGAASWLADAPADVEDVVEYAAPAPDDIEEDFADELDGKDLALSADQMILVKRAIGTLTDLLNVVQGDVEVKAIEPEDETDDAEPDDDEDDDVQEYDSLVEAIDDIVDDEDVYNALIDAASGIDNALNDDNIEALDQASNEFLDGIQTQMKRDGVDVQLLRDLASTVADLIQQVGGVDEGGEEMPSEDTIEKKQPEDDMEATDEATEEAPVEAPEGKTILSVEEIQSFIADFNAK